MSDRAPSETLALLILVIKVLVVVVVVVVVALVTSGSHVEHRDPEGLSFRDSRSSKCKQRVTLVVRPQSRVVRV